MHLCSPCLLPTALMYFRTLLCWCLQEVYELSSDRLYATYFGGDAKLGLSADEEARQIWQVQLSSDLLLCFLQAGPLYSSCRTADVVLLSDI